jgi:hypothetical protein
MRLQHLHLYIMLTAKTLQCSLKHDGIKVVVVYLKYMTVLASCGLLSLTF